MGDLVLEAKNLVKRFPQGKGEVEILHGIHVSLGKGEIVAVMGPSGAGKSTLLHILGLMERPTDGSLWITGKNTLSLDLRQKAGLRNSTLGFLFQFHHLLPELSVEENVLLPARIRGAASLGSQTRARQLLESVSLSPQSRQKPATLSGGEQQRAALARALMNEPAILLADEPTGNLDKETGGKVLDLLWSESRRRAASLMIVTHQEDIAKRADRVIHLRDGRVDTSR